MHVCAVAQQTPAALIPNSTVLGCSARLVLALLPGKLSVQNPGNYYAGNYYEGQAHSTLP